MAKLRVVTGKKGSGKSLYAVRQVIDQLRFTDRFIVTNLALFPDRLNEYMQERWPDYDCRVLQRLVVVEDKRMLQQFWRIRGRNADGSLIVRQKFGEYEEQAVDGRLVRVPWDYVQHVAYVIDEGQAFFNAREWSKTGSELGDYASQMRKLDDEVWVLCPWLRGLDIQFKGYADECIVLQNFYKLKFKGMTMPRMIRWLSYDNCPPLPGEEPFQKGNFEMDIAGVASCYATEKGANVAGSQADKGSIARGVPWWMGVS